MHFSLFSRQVTKTTFKNITQKNSFTSLPLAVRRFSTDSNGDQRPSKISTTLENEELRNQVEGLKEELKLQRQSTEKVSNVLEETYVFLLLGGLLSSLSLMGDQTSIWHSPQENDPHILHNSLPFLKICFCTLTLKKGLDNPWPFHRIFSNINLKYRIIRFYPFFRLQQSLGAIICKFLIFINSSAAVFELEQTLVIME